MAGIIPKLQTLVSFGRAVLGSIACMKERLEGEEGRPECLTDPKLGPVRKHFAAKFPEQLTDRVR